jgi:hypothetical protein
MSKEKVDKPLNQSSNKAKQNIPPSSAPFAQTEKTKVDHPNSNNVETMNENEVLNDAVVVGVNAWTEAKARLDIVHELKNVIKPKLLSQTDTQNELMRVKMKMGKSVGQLTPSQKQLIKVAKQIVDLFTDAQKKSSEYYQTTMYFAAKKIVKQAETEVAVKKETAFPLAIVCVNLISKHPPFLNVLFGRMMKKCVFLIPCYPKKQKVRYFIYPE